jgi:predicted secreted hydrolase
MSAPVAIFLALMIASWGACHSADPPPGPAVLSPVSLLGGEAGKDQPLAGFARAIEARPFSFPDDHGPHPAFRSEWWYFTGVVHARARRFGYQLTVFRQALASASEVAPRASAWATRDVYMAHLAIADIDGPSSGARFQAHERFARDGLALAGAQVRPFLVWVDAWRMRGPDDPSAFFPVQLSARAGGSAIELTVAAGRGPIPQGERGLSAKGPDPGNASYYYSCTRLPTQGRLTIAGQTFDVTGESWLDREWSTGALGAGVVGWDWLGVSLSDGRDLMVYRLRTADGGATPASRVTLIAPDGTTRLFGPDAFTLTPIESWLSPQSGVRYPAALRLRIRSEPLDLTVRPLLADQELRLTVRYWEGAVAVEGNASHASTRLTGSGYLELTGYPPASPP